MFHVGCSIFSRSGQIQAEDSQLLNAHNTFLKTQCDGLKCELSVREAEISSLKTRLDSTDRTNQETKMHLEGNITRGGFKGQYVSPPPML